MSRNVVAAALLAGAFAACGGCPWTQLSAVAITPAQPCLTVTTADSSGTAPSAGCVSPVLIVHNGCADALTFPAVDAEDGAVHVIAAGADGTIEVPIGIATSQHPINNADRYDWMLDATLGATPIVLAFHASL